MGNLTRDRQTKACSLSSAGFARAYLLKGLEDDCLVLLTDANACVSDLEMNSTRRLIWQNHHVNPALLGEFHGITQEVVQDLPHSSRISGDPSRAFKVAIE